MSHHHWSPPRKRPASATKGLTPRQELAAEAIVVARTLREAAVAAQVSERSVRRWLALPAFRAAIRNARSHLLAEASSRLVVAAGEAVDTLRQILSGDADDQTRCVAARAILTFAFRVEETDIAEELEKLRDLLEEDGRRNVPRVGA